MRLRNFCQYCDRPLSITEKHPLSGGITLLFYRCGHFAIRNRPHFEIVPDRDFSSTTGQQTAYNYQQTFLDWFFNESEGDSALNADQMGLGKTPQALLALKRWRLIPGNESKTALVVVPGATLWQWFQQYKNWTSFDVLGTYMISTSKGFLPPGFKTYIIPMDTFSRMVRSETNSFGRVINTYIEPQLTALDIRFLIVDECHKFKDISSNRARALTAFCRSAAIERKLFLSGTPIMNRADEYFTVLNLIDPEEFDTIENFRRRWLIQDGKGKWTRIHPRRIEAFRDLVGKYVIRREVSEVKKDLPAFRRTFSLLFIEDDTIKKAYNKELKNLENLVRSTARFSFHDVQESLMTLRRLCGIGKVAYAADYIETFLDAAAGDSEMGIAGDPAQQKIAVGVHHHAVRDGLYLALVERGIKTFKLSGEDGNEQKYKIVQDFIKHEGRAVIVISTLAGGTGVDGLQHACSTVINLERQWNSVNEEQFEARFWRDGQKFPVHSDYLIARGTIDEWFCELVEQKRAIFQQTVNNQWDLAGDENMLKDLVNKILGGRLT